MHLGFLGGTVVENLFANAGYMGSIPDPGRSTSRGETRLMCHNYWACAIEPGNRNCWVYVLPLLKPVCLGVCVLQQEMVVKVAQSCPTLCDPMDYTAHGILQARILEWVAFPFSRGSSQPRDQTQGSHIAGGFFSSWVTREGQENWSG